MFAIYTMNDDSKYIQVIIFSGVILMSYVSIDLIAKLIIGNLNALF